MSLRVRDDRGDPRLFIQDDGWMSALAKTDRVAHARAVARHTPGWYRRMVLAGTLGCAQFGVLLIGTTVADSLIQQPDGWGWLVRVSLIVLLLGFGVLVVAGLFGGRLANRARARARLASGRCGGCLYDMSGIGPEHDGARVCPECGAAWRIEASAVFHDRAPGATRDEG